MGSSPSLYAVPKHVSLDLGNCTVEQVLPHDRKRTKLLIETITASFAGSEKTAPEGGVDWTICADERKGKHFEPLGEPASAFRLRVVRWMALMALLKYGKYGACFLLISKETGSPVGATICAPPGKRIHEETLWESIKTAFMAICWYRGPGLFWNGWGRLMAAKDALEKCHGSTPSALHWYVCMFATHPNAQGKGYGKRFLLFLAALADAAKVESYLEATGPRNVSFYSGVANYETKKTVKMVAKDSVFDDDGGVHGMVRPFREVN